MAYPSNTNRRFLIDECLSPDLAGIARERGHDAGHVARYGRAGVKDWYLVPFVIEHDMVLVTNNARDFRRLYAELDIHPGLVLILPKVRQPRQAELFARALDAIESRRDTINAMVEVDGNGHVTISDWPTV